MKCPSCGYHVTGKNALTCKLCGGSLVAPPAPGDEPAAPEEAPVAAPRKTWTRHLILRTGAPPLDLVPGVRFTIGRGPETSLPIPSARVSREHAEIAWEGEGQDARAVLRDLDSQNGTHVRGLRLTGPRTLEDQDEVTVGPYSFSYRRVSGYGSVGRLQSVLDSAMRTKPMVGDAWSGQLETLGLVDVLQTLDQHQKTGRLDLLAGDQDAHVLIEDGKPVHASAGDLEGPAAMAALLGWKDGLYRFAGGAVAASPRTLSGSTMAILIAAGQTLDQQQRGPA
jgi:pSer/pThr/pTyr-binding forkhead associated (FHA) protein